MHRTGAILASALALMLVILCVGSLARAQAPPRQGGPPPSPRAAAPIELTGYWVSLVTEDWRFRVATPPKGDYTSVPLNPAGRKVADAWNPAADEAAGDQCKGYGAGGVMRLPGRLHIAWQDDRTLKVELDAGTQTRTLSFAAPGPGGGWQGASRATWDRSESVMGGRGLLPFARGAGPGAAGGALKVVTTGMKAGYLRKNGVPYSADAVITEYFDRLDVPSGGMSLLVVSTEVVDPVYLTEPFWTSTHFKKQADASMWNPTTCAAR